MNRVILYIGSAVLTALLPILAIVMPVYAISNPDSTPTIQNQWVWRNVLETDDMFVLVYENTPYASPPTDYTYTEAFVWRFMNGVTELGQALGYAYHDDGYGYNVISFYFDAASAPVWAGSYTLTLSGNPTAFTTIPSYSYSIPSSAYSSLTNTNDVKADIADKIIFIASDLYVRWGLTATTTLVDETDTATVLSIRGQTFFRGAVYGLQGIAPAAFALTTQSYALTDEVWTDSYTTALAGQHAGNPIETAMDAGENFLDVNYNLMGMLIVLIICAGVLFGNWYLAGGTLWKYMPEMAAISVISARMGLLGIGELSLIAAIAVLYSNARIWRLL